MGRMSLKIFSDTPPYDPTAKWFGALFAVIGAFFLANVIAHLTRQPWDLAETGVEIQGKAGEVDRLLGDRYTIEVDGVSHACHRGELKFPATEAPILYDPADPSRCRAIDSVEGLSSYEKTNLVIGTLAMFVGLSIVLARVAEPRDLWAREDPPGLLRPRVMFVARIVLAVGVVTGVVHAIFSIGRGLGRGEQPPPRSVAEVSETPVEPAPVMMVSKEVPMPETTLRIVEGNDWPLAKPRLRKIAVRGPAVWVGDPAPIGSRLVVSTGPSYFGSGDRHRLVDVASGRVLAAFDKEGLTSATAKVVVTRVDDQPVIVHAEDGRIVAPEITLPASHLVADVRIVPSNLDARIWLFARSDEGVVFHGEWLDPRAPDVRLTETIPFWPMFARGDAGVEVWTADEVATRREACSWLRFETGATHRCLHHGPTSALASPLGPFMAGPWRVDGPFDAVIANSDTGTRQAVVTGCEATEIGRLLVPPRALGMCRDGSDTAEKNDDDTRRFGLWSPEQTWTFTAHLTIDRIGLGPQREPVVALEPIGRADAPTTRWIDLERGHLYRSPPVFVPGYSGSFGFARRILAHRTDNLDGLWVIDLDAGTIERIVADLGCNGEVLESSLVGERAVIGCTTAGVSGSDAERLHSYRWTEVIDFAKRKRWRTDAAFDARVAADGTVAGVTRKRPAELIAIDTP